MRNYLMGTMYTIWMMGTLKAQASPLKISMQQNCMGTPKICFYKVGFGMRNGDTVPLKVRGDRGC